MRTTLAFFIAMALAMGHTAYAQGTSAAAALKIVVIEGEDAVNIIQQKTAVAPLVEVRDRNNLPISGATVTFSVTGPGAAFAGGAPSITVVTNAAGQAAAAGLTPTATGAIQISATATFQGETAIATIAQSNVLTAAEAVGTTAGAGGGAGSTGTSTAGAAGGGGGGMSATTIGIIGAAVGGGAAVATTAAGGGNDAPSSTSTSPTTTTPTATTAPTTPTTPPPTQQPTSSSFTGPMDGTFTGTSSVTFVGEPGTTCNFTTRNTGTVTLRMQTAAGGVLSGTFEINGRQVVTVSTCGELAGVINDQPLIYTASVDGSGGTVRFTQEFRDSGTVPGASYTSSATISFTGTVAGGGVTGTLTYNALADIRGDGFTSHATWTGNIPISLR